MDAREKLEESEMPWPNVELTGALSQFLKSQLLRLILEKLSLFRLSTVLLSKVLLKTRKLLLGN